MEKSFFSPREHNWDNYVLLILKCKQQIRKTNKVLHVSASNHILSDLHTVIRNKQQVFLELTCCSITFHIRPETVTRVRYDEH